MRPLLALSNVFTLRDRLSRRVKYTFGCRGHAATQASGNASFDKYLESTNLVFSMSRDCEPDRFIGKLLTVSVVIQDLSD